ncbi:MAG: CPBP family intramembrane metalloprotease [Ancrocorticia sp.]
MTEQRSGRASSGRLRRPGLFLVLVLVLSVPFYFLNLLDIPMPQGLPPSALMIAVPTIVALFLTYRERGVAGLNELFVPFGTAPNRWLLFSILAVPTLVGAMYAITVLLGWEELGPSALSLSSIPAVAVLYFFGAIPEELGWTMYATKPLLDRYDRLRAGVLIGTVWGLWHVVPFMSQGRDWVWIVGQVGVSITLRIIMVTVFEHTQGALLPALILHASINLYPDMLPGGLNSYYPGILALLYVAAVMAMPRTISRPSAAPPGRSSRPRCQ